MKHKFFWAGAVALAVTVSSQVEIIAQTNGAILISTRKGQDISYSTADELDQKGPGQASQGDVAMAELLGDYGYSSRIIVDAAMNSALPRRRSHPIPYSSKSGF